MKKEKVGKDTKPIKYEVKKDYKGFISIRSYIVSKAISKGKDIVVYFKGEVMTIPNDYLKYAGQLHKKKFKSRYSDKEYELYDFKFISDNSENKSTRLF